MKDQRWKRLAVVYKAVEQRRFSELRRVSAELEQTRCVIATREDEARRVCGSGGVCDPVEMAVAAISQSHARRVLIQLIERRRQLDEDENVAALAFNASRIESEQMSIIDQSSARELRISQERAAQAAADDRFLHQASRLTQVEGEKLSMNVG